MTDYFKDKDDEKTVYSADNLSEYLNDVCDEDYFEEHINDNEEDVEICGYSWRPGEVFKNMDEYSFDNEKREWLNDIARDYEDKLSELKVGEELVIDELSLTIIGCDEDGHTEETYTDVDWIEIPSEAYTIHPVEDGKKYEVVWVDEEEKTQHKVTIPKALLMGAIMSILSKE